jgi:hypothetical protein
VEAVVLKALERLPADRFETAAELTAALKDKAFRHGVGVGPAAGPWKGLAVGATAVALLLLVTLVAVCVNPDPSPPVLRQEIRPPGDGAIVGWSRNFALAPDGSSLVYRDTVGLESGRQLWVKRRGSADGEPLSGTESAIDVVYSPDGRAIAYTVATDLKTRPVQGAGTRTLLEGLASGIVGLSWMDDGTILCEQPGNTLVRVPVSDGVPIDTVFTFDRGIWWARGLPGSEAALVVLSAGTEAANGSTLDVLDLRRNNAWTLKDEVLKAWYVPTGHVVWVRRDGAVFATPFDLDRLEMGEPDVPLFEGVRVTTNTADMVMAEDGTVLYVEGTPLEAPQRQVVWVSRNGGVEPVDPEWEAANFETLALSPDGRRLALEIAGEEAEQIWVKELYQGGSFPLTTDEGASLRPAWSPDGTTIAYSTTTAGKREIRAAPSDGRSVGSYEILVALGDYVSEPVYTHDGERLLFRARPVSGPTDIGYLDLATGEVNDTFLVTGFKNVGMAISPDDKWLAYTSNASGQNEVYVRPYPDVTSYRQVVSRDGASDPVWNPDGRELFYRRGDGWMIGARYSADSVFRVEEREPLFDARPFEAKFMGGGYDFSYVEDRFVMVLLDALGTSGQNPEPRMIQIQNFFTELEDLVER